jgi:hypothetical protein
MKKYYISHNTNDIEKADNIELWKSIENFGKHITTEFDFDYIIATYEKDNKTYKLYFNDNLGIMSYIEEI